MNPKILLSYSRNSQNYVDAIEKLEGIPTAEYLPSVNTDYDGLLLCGGEDIAPRYYNEEIRTSKVINEERDRAEFALLDAFVKAGKPVMGICRGMQLINVFFGGSLTQHIATADERHYALEGGDFVHKVNAEGDSIVQSLYGDSFYVNSRHHQAVNKIGNGLKVAAVSSEDGVIECIEHSRMPIFGTQWHPERMCFANKRTDTVDGSAVLKYFLDMCVCKAAL
ncbi:MAG: gamma-glutamyl-gamma-aminobutyrate hydrolase family protein [Ruminococcaceae bacterium]|nr:gamma-glutamyl-gamma-aminobutyrate hydrolase family protein [Oscillospiraceae bacterium]